MKSKFLAIGLLVFHASVGQAQDGSFTLFEKAGCILKARAYVDPSLLPGTRLNPANRFDLFLFQNVSDQYRWDFTLPQNDSYHYTNLNSGYGKIEDATKAKVTISATLHQFATYDEKLTFKNLKFLPDEADAKRRGDWPRFLAVQEDQTLTTPSGISITIPASKPVTPGEMMAAGNGFASGLYIPIQVTPNTKLVSPLPDSPLFRQHGRAVTIKLEVAEPFSLIWYAADNTYKGIKVGIPKLHSIDNLNELTIIVRQRVELKTVPVSFEVPVSKGNG